MRAYFGAITLATILAGCGTQNDRYQSAPAPNNDDRITKLEQQLLALQGTQTQINNLITSDYATCPTSGDTADPLINKMCKVAQAATVEARVELKGQLGVLNDAISDQLTAVSENLVALQTQQDADLTSINSQIASINATLTSISSTITSLSSRITTAEGAITALQTLTASISGTVAGAMESVDIGSENLAAGPFFESVLRRTDKTKIVAYVDARGTTTAMASNPLTAVNGSATITVAATAHGFAVGDSVHFSELTAARGFSATELAADFTVVTVPNANSFTITMTHTATSSGTLGGTTGTMYKIIGRGMGTVWKTADGADAAVRVSTAGTKDYNFAVKATGDICYDKTNRLATLATINAAGVNIVCK